ncbi:hypothetical protein XPA_000334 [Xanthoria parietina]
MDTADQLPALATIPQLPAAERALLLDRLFEPCVPLHTLSLSLLQQNPFASYDELIGSVGLQLTALANSSSTSDAAWLQTILAAHPRLGQGKVESSQSRSEQAQLNTGSESSAQSLAELNHLYEQTFPGLRYVVFVNGRSRDVIMDDMKTRIDRQDRMAEMHAAIKAMCDIAKDRAHKIGVKDNGR